MTTYYVDSAGNDSNAGTSAGSGNSWLTFQKAADTAVAGDLVNIKSDKTYNELVDFDTNAGSVASRIRFRGYTTTPGDGGKVTVDGANSRAYCFACNGTADYVTWENLILTGATSACINFTTNGSIGLRFKKMRFTKGSGTPTTVFKSSDYNSVTSSNLVGCLIDNMSAIGIQGSVLVGQIGIIGCRIIDCGGIGISFPNYRGIFHILHNIIARNGGDGINLGGNNAGGSIFGNTIHANTGDGIDINAANEILLVIRNNLITGHSGGGSVGLRCGTPSGNTNIDVDYNAYYNNTAHTSGSAAVGDNDLTLGADPYNNASGSDWTLKAGSARAAAFPGDIDGTNIGYLDMGALQHQDSGGGSTIVIPTCTVNIAGMRPSAVGY